MPDRTHLYGGRPIHAKDSKTSYGRDDTLQQLERAATNRRNSVRAQNRPSDGGRSTLDGRNSVRAQNRPSAGGGPTLDGRDSVRAQNRPWPGAGLLSPRTPKRPPAGLDRADTTLSMTPSEVIGHRPQPAFSTSRLPSLRPLLWVALDLNRHRAAPPPPLDQHQQVSTGH